MSNLTEYRDHTEELADSILPVPSHDAELNTAILTQHKNDPIPSAADYTRHLIRLTRFGR